KWETLPECVMLIMEPLLDVKMELSMNAGEANKGIMEDMKTIDSVGGMMAVMSKIENNMMMKKEENHRRLIVYNCNIKRR
ncbi:20100_t:CDS:1, partial [Gigaspora rosea]